MTFNADSSSGMAGPDVARSGSTSVMAPAVTWRTRFARMATVVRRIVGVPDYGVYLAHMHAHHPECTPLDARTFERERLVDRYSRPGSRCC